MKYNKIFILGTSGSGKTTLANQISKKTNISHHNLDDIFWYKRFSKKRNPKRVDFLMKKILKEKRWIVEGVYGWWTEIFAQKSDLIIFLDLPFRKLAWRNLKRYLFENEKRPNEDFKNLLRLIKYIKRYKKGEHEGSYICHKKIINKHKVNLIVIKKNSQIKELLEKF